MSRWQCIINGCPAVKFPPRNSHWRATRDLADYLDEASPVLAAEWLAALAEDDDPDFKQWGRHAQLVEYVAQYHCNEREARRLARRALCEDGFVIEVVD